MGMDRDRDRSMDLKKDWRLDMDIYTMYLHCDLLLSGLGAYCFNTIDTKSS
jgi:hypothetical protein